LRAEDEPGGFKLVSPEGAPLDIIYKTELRGNRAKLHLGKKPTGGVNLFYGHGFSPRCNITDARGFSLPVFGPFPIGNTKPRAFMPFITEWKVSEIVPGSKKLDRVPLPDMEALGATVKSYLTDGFINERSIWATRTGQAFFHSRVHLSEPMELEFLMGYDGPFRLWLDGKPFFKNMAGINPCFPDESGKTASLKAGTHDLHVGMDLNDGLAWGFFLRMTRKDVTDEQIQTGKFVKPTYSV
jgi:sialate O-acetylesterase